ncbi:MAG: hypothetical protein ACLFTL_08845 [Alphaproteobacteria bacterium]
MRADATVTPLPSEAERRAPIDAAAAAADHRQVVPAPAGYIELPVTTIAQDLLVYRPDNGRILAEVAAAADARGEDVGHLRSRVADGEVQALLHDLLLAAARDPRAPIFEELAKHRRQTEPLLITRAGVVVNGNRRLAAMRELRADDPARFDGFATVEAAVLPSDIAAADVEFIEAALQMAPSLRLEYGWINRRLKLRQHARDLDRGAIMAAYGFKDPAAVDAELAELELAEAYLAWIGEPGHYHRVAAAETAFVALRRQLDGIRDGALAALWRTLGFAMLRAQSALDADILHYFPFAEPRPSAVRQWVPRTLAEERALVPPQPAGENRGLDAASAAALRRAVDDPAAAAATARAVVNLTDTLKAEPDRFLGASRVLHQLRAARKTLEAQPGDPFTPVQRRQVRAELASLEAYVTAFEDGRDVRPTSGRRLLPRAFRRWLARFT